eukprot:gene15939-16233_t
MTGFVICLCAMAQVRAEKSSPLERLLGVWVDDYGDTHNITSSCWSQGRDNNYNIKYTDRNGTFLVAQNDAGNTWDAGEWSRYDWVFNKSIPLPYEFGFCMAAWNASTEEGAKQAIGVDYNDLYKGCFGWPFTIMKRLKNATTVDDKRKTNVK